MAWHSGGVQLAAVLRGMPAAMTGEQLATVAWKLSACASGARAHWSLSYLYGYSTQTYGVLLMWRDREGYLIL